MIQAFYERVPESMRQLSGAVFNSGSEAFGKPSPLYVLGLNPGGDPEKHVMETVEYHSRQVFDKPGVWSAYRDDSWDGRTPGTAGMQPGVLHALECLDLAPHSVPTSNLIFVRTRAEKDIKRFPVLADLCWPFHEAVIDQLNVKVVLCFGRKTGNWVRKRVRANKLVDRFVETNKRNWKSEAFVNPEGLHVIVASHPARAAWTTKDADPSLMIKSVLSSANIQ